MHAYAYQNNPKCVLKASSGGAFQRITEEIISKAKQYSIYGAAWTDDLEVEHIRIDDVKKIGILQGSKYVRSRFSNSLRLIKEDLKAGTTVVFSGTPCQVAAVLKFAEKEKISTELLYTIEIICHGTPEMRVWNDCLNWVERRFSSRIKNVCFRDKRIGWKHYPTSYYFENGRSIHATYEAQLYIRLFMSSLITTKGCFSCPYANTVRKADITIGDFWGIEDIMPDFPVGNGVSLILANAPKGYEVIESVVESLREDELIRKCVDDSFLKYQHNLNSATEKPTIYDEFWIDYNERGFDFVIRKYKFYTLYWKLRFYVRKAADQLKRQN